MTENEAIEVLKNFDMQVSAKADGAYQSTIGEMACKLAVKSLECKQRIIEIVNQQLIAGKDNYKEIYDSFYKIVKIVQENY